VGRREREIDIDRRAAAHRLGIAERHAAALPRIARRLSVSCGGSRVHRARDHERALIEHEHAPSGARKLVREDGARGAAADDHIVEHAGRGREHMGRAVVAQPRRRKRRRVRAEILVEPRRQDHARGHARDRGAERRAVRRAQDEHAHPRREQTQTVRIAALEPLEHAFSVGRREPVESALTRLRDERAQPRRAAREDIESRERRERGAILRGLRTGGPEPVARRACQRARRGIERQRVVGHERGGASCTTRSEDSAGARRAVGADSVFRAPQPLAATNNAKIHRQRWSCFDT
jgi:hypothetical protein